MGVQVIQSDILSWAVSYDGPLAHACLCDAPYEMEFMGKGWDNSGIAFNPETWRAIARCLHPGAFLFVFAGTINDDLISVAMRQAGLRKYHKAAAWSYGSGFPKAAKLDTIIDRRAGVERTKIGTKKHQPKFDAKGFEYRKKDNGYNSKDRETFDVTVPATELAQAWAGHRYGGQVLKPALESILIFQKPYAGDPVSSITATGAGAINVDGTRIDTGERWARNNAPGQNGVFNASGGPVESGAGRWPANLILSHHEACEPIGTRRVRGSASIGRNRDAAADAGTYSGGYKKDTRDTSYADPDGMETVAAWACHPDCTVRRLGAQSGEGQSVSRKPTGIDERGQPNDLNWRLRRADTIARGHDDTGTAARFFFNADFMYERLEDTDAVIYEAKSSRSEREAGLDPMQVRLVNSEAFAESTINDGRAKAIDNPYQRGETTRRNIHPTIKPISLCRHLATLLLPPAEYAPRRLLIPFSGAGSEMIGALLAGWEDVIGIELEEDHCRIASARLAYWQQRRHEFLDPSKPITAALNEASDDQLELF